MSEGFVVHEQLGRSLEEWREPGAAELCRVVTQVLERSLD